MPVADGRSEGSEGEEAEPAARLEQHRLILADLIDAVVEAEEQVEPAPATLRRGAAAAAALATVASELSSSRSALLDQAGTLLLRCYERTGAESDLAAARERLVAAAADTTVDDPARWLTLAHLGRAWRATYRLSEDPADLDRAMSADLAAVAATPPKAPHDPVPMAGLAASLREQFHVSGDPDLLDRAITLDEENLARLAPADPGRPMVLHGLANGLDLRHERGRDPDDLRRLVTAREQVLATSEPGSRDHAYVLCALANAYSRRWSALGAAVDLDRAVDLATAALRVDGPDRIGRARMLRDRASHLRKRYEERRAADDLAQAVEDYQASIALCEPGGPEWQSGTEGLGFCFQSRYTAEGDFADLEQVIARWEEVARHTAESAPDAGGRAMNLGNAFRARYVRTQAQQDLDRAITGYEKSIALPSATTEDECAKLVNLAAALQDRYDRSEALADLSRARECCATASRMSDPGTIHWRHARNHLGRALFAEATRVGSLVTLRQAQAVFRDVVDRTAPDTPEHLQARLNLAGTRAWAWRATHDRSAHRSAVADLATVSRTGGRIEPGVELAAARLWGELAAAEGDWPQAARGYRAAMSSLALIYRRQARRDLKQIWLLDGVGLPAAATYALVRSGDPADAALAAESGRAWLLSDALDRVSSDLTALAATEHAWLATAYRRARARVAAAERATAGPEAVGVLTTGSRAPAATEPFGSPRPR